MTQSHLIVKEEGKTPEKFLREAFGEEIIAKENTIYPDSVQRPRIYEAMNAYAEYRLIEHTAEKKPMTRNEWLYGKSPEIDKEEEQFSRRELEMAFCFGLLNQKDVTIDLLSEQLKTAEDKIELMVDAVLRTCKP